MSKTETLHVELSEARTGLVAALAEGADTAQHRQRIADLEEQIAAVERQAREERAAASRAEAAAVEQAATVLASQTHTAVDAASAVAGLAELTGEPLPAVPEDPAIVAAAREVTRCRAILERAEMDLKPVAEQARMLSSRLAEKNAAADAIKRRRLAGDERSADAAELLTLTSDAEALQLLVGDANAKVAAADVRPAARAALSAAEQQLEHARRQAAYRAALERVRLVEGIFVATWKTMVDLGRAAGAGSPWAEYKASPEAVRAVTGAIVPGFRGQL